MAFNVPNNFGHTPLVIGESYSMSKGPYAWVFKLVLINEITGVCKLIHRGDDGPYYVPVVDLTHWHLCLKFDSVSLMCECDN